MKIIWFFQKEIVMKLISKFYFFCNSETHFVAFTASGNPANPVKIMGWGVDRNILRVNDILTLRYSLTEGEGPFTIKITVINEDNVVIIKDTLRFCK